MGENVKKQKKSGSINAFVIVFLVIVGCYIMSLFVSPGAFDREVLNWQNRCYREFFPRNGKDVFRTAGDFPVDSEWTCILRRHDVPRYARCRMYRSLQADRRPE